MTFGFNVKTILISSLVIAQSSFAASQKSSDFQVYLNGEKPHFATPVSSKQNILAHTARNGFYLLTVELPIENKKKLIPLMIAELVSKNNKRETASQNSQKNKDKNTKKNSVKKNNETGGEKNADGKTENSLGNDLADNVENNVQLKSYVLGSHQFKKSSSELKVSGEVIDIAVPNELAEKVWFHIPAENVPKKATYLFEIYTPRDQKPGLYDLEIKFQIGGKNENKTFTLPLSLQVHEAVIPDHLDLKTSFGFSPSAVLKKHYGKWVAEELKLYQKYLAMSSEHRIDLHKIYLDFPQVETKDGQTDPDLLRHIKKPTPSFHEQMLEVQSGALSSLNYQWSTTDLPVPEKQKTNPTPLYWKSLAASAKKLKLDNNFVYFVDEPQPKDLPNLVKKVKEIKQWAPDLKYLVTTHYRPALEDSFNVWCVNIIQWDRPGFPKPSFYLARREEKNEDFWLYVGCNSHGCSGPEDILNPDLVIDRAAAYNVAFPWMAWRYQARGILYYNTVEAYSHDFLSPWQDPFLFTGYGEGNLFYPCKPEICGGKDQFPIASLRLKVLRQGLEDVQLLTMAEKKSTDVREWVQKLIPNSRKFPTEMSEYEKIKVKALEVLDKKETKKSSP